MAPVLVAMSRELIIEEVFGTGGTALCGLLSCGHYSPSYPPMSPVWDSPDQPHQCPNGCGERQFDINLQVMMMSMSDAVPPPRRPYDWAADDDWRLGR